MKKSNEPQKPFFAKFLESQKMEDPANEVVGGGGSPFLTLKHPSDLDEPVTMKYPSDGDDHLYA